MISQNVKNSMELVMQKQNEDKQWKEEVLATLRNLRKDLDRILEGQMRC